MFLKSTSKLLMGLTLVILLILVGCGKGTGPQSSWKAPMLSEFRRASEWGAQQEEDPGKWWTVCESGPCQVSPDWRGGPKIHVATPLAITAMSAYVSTELDEETLVDVRAQFSNELIISLIFEGTIWDLDTAYEAVITQGDLVIHPFQSSLDYNMEVWEMGVAITLECRLKIKDLDPDKPFWFSATQAVGSQRFEFKIDPNNLGTEEFF
ncbi:hypothetical protein KAV67_04500 [Candidatus Bipolaricaulota bacterium]|nr:hypothetical protein [Candidatus Bipolaricaulota bacterium]